MRYKPRPKMGEQTKPKDPERVKLLIRLPPTLLEKVDVTARRERKSRNAFITASLEKSTCPTPR